MKVQISIVHFAEDHQLRFNDVLADQVESIRFFTKYPYRLNIIDNQMPAKARKDLDEKLPDEDILRTSGRYNTFPAGANHAIENMSGDYLFLSHTDLLMGWNWLDCLTLNLQSAEIKEGVPCATCPILIFYPKKKGSPTRFKGKAVEEIAGEWVKDEDSCEAVKAYMEKHRVPYKMWGNRPVAVSRSGKVTDNGWRLGGAYLASKKFFDEVGPYDPIINRMNDKSYGIRALMTDCKVTKSNLVYLHHLSALHAKSGVYRGEYFAKQLPPERRGKGSYGQFILKWGENVFKKVQDGTIWMELHEAQRMGGGSAARKLVEKYMREEV